MSEDVEEGHLHARDIRRQTGDERGRREAVDVGEREGLDLIVRVLPEVGSEARARLGSELAAQNAACKRHEPQHKHDAAVDGDLNEIFLNKIALRLLRPFDNADEQRHDEGDEDLHRRLDDHDDGR